MATNDFQWFASSGGANVISQAQYVALTTLIQDGFVDGIAVTEQVDKVLRQATGPGAALTEYVRQTINQNIVDDGVVTNLEMQIWLAQLLSGYFVDHGSANTIVTVNPSGLTFPAPVAGLKVRILLAFTNNSSTVNYNHFGTGNHPVTYSDGNLPGSGDLPGGSFLELIYNAVSTRWEISSFSIAALRGLGTLINVQQFTNQTRTSMTGTSGATVVAWSGFNYVKKSPTSKVLAILNSITYCPGATAPSGITLTIGGQAFPSVAANNFSGTNTGATTLINIYSGLPAGSLAVSLSYSRNDGVTWTDVINPTTVDNAYLASSNPSVLLIGELGI